MHDKVIEESSIETWPKIDGLGSEGHFTGIVIDTYPPEGIGFLG